MGMDWKNIGVLAGAVLIVGILLFGGVLDGGETKKEAVPETSGSSDSQTKTTSSRT